MMKNKEFHDAAMECIDNALIARRAGDLKEAARLFREALALETDACNVTDYEPAHTILVGSVNAIADTIVDLDEQIANL